MESIEKARSTIVEVRTGLLFGGMDYPDIETLAPLAEQEWRLALAHLEIADACLAKLQLHQARELADRTLGR